MRVHRIIQKTFKVHKEDKKEFCSDVVILQS